MKTLKQKITDKFDKNKFELLNCGQGADHDWLGVDPYIRTFLQKLNQNPHISTLFSCEGHNPTDTAYLLFNVDAEGWDTFWNLVLPELTYKFNYVNPNDTDTSHVLQFYTSIMDNEHVTGINMNCYLPEDYPNKKERFWQTLFTTFLSYYATLEPTK